MPKIATPKPDYTPTQFAAALKRSKITHVRTFMGDTFTDTETGEKYAGIFLGRTGPLLHRLTIKNILSLRAAHAARPTKAKRAPVADPASPPLL